MTQRRIAVFTGNRAEFGLQYPILRAIDKHPELQYQLIVSGAHLDPAFGGTVSEITKAGLSIHAEVDIEVADDSVFATAQAIGKGVINIGQALLELQPDIVVVYADRFESFAAVIAATQMHMPTAHVEGGDRTDGGALDDSVRHAMTKLSHLHFTTNKKASNRVLAMGEEPWRVHTVGLPALDVIAEGFFAKPDELQGVLDIDTNIPLVVFTQHSVSTQADAAIDQMRPSIEVLRCLAEEGVRIVATYPNNDAGGRRIIAELRALADEGHANISLHQSLGRHIYHGLLALAATPGNRVACVGNSSSGIKETPAFHCPTVNIGSRQDGRSRAINVIDVDYDADAILAAVQLCLFDDAIRTRCQSCDNPYGIGNASQEIARVLAETPLGQRLIQKIMALKGEVRDGCYS